MFKILLIFVPVIWISSNLHILWCYSVSFFFCLAFYICCIKWSLWKNFIRLKILFDIQCLILDHCNWVSEKYCIFSLTLGTHNLLIIQYGYSSSQLFTLSLFFQLFSLYSLFFLYSLSLSIYHFWNEVLLLFWRRPESITAKMIISIYLLILFSLQNNLLHEILWLPD